MKDKLTAPDWKLLAEALDYLAEGWEHTREGGHPEAKRIERLASIIGKRAYGRDKKKESGEEANG